MKKILFLATSILLSAAVADSPVLAQTTNTWTADTTQNSLDQTQIYGGNGPIDGGAVAAQITGGPWTLDQGPAADYSLIPPTTTLPQGDTPNPATHYCSTFATKLTSGPNSGTYEEGTGVVGLNTSNNKSSGTAATSYMQPFYYQSTTAVSGSGTSTYLEGYFDYRPKDTDEAIVVAYSNNSGLTWTFQQEGLELNPGLCPSGGSKTNEQTYPAVTGTNNPYTYVTGYDDLLNFPTDASGSGSPGAADDGQGHPTVITAPNGNTYLYTLDRSENPQDGNTPDGPVDDLGLVVHQLTTAQNSSNPQPLTGVPATSPDTVTNKGTRTNGLLNPDGIIASVPGTNPLIVIYVQKQLGQDPNLLPSNELCPSPTFGFQKGATPNTDYVTVRLARTSDGINFTDMGPVTGLNDQTTTSETGVRYIASIGTLLRLPNNRYGLFFAGGNCIDADSDAFHFIGYAESSNLRTWTIVNGITNPIVSVGTETDPNTNVTIPSTPALIPTEQWFEQRAYTPNAIVTGPNEVSLIFSGYSTDSPKNNYANYRTIGQVYLKSSLQLLPF
jgi:hypothetical protein